MLLGPARLVPSLNNRLLLEVLLDDASSGGAGELSDAERGEGEVLEGEGLAGNGGCGTINDGL